MVVGEGNESVFESTIKIFILGDRIFLNLGDRIFFMVGVGVVVGL